MTPVLPQPLPVAKEPPHKPNPGGRLVTTLRADEEVVIIDQLCPSNDPIHISVQRQTSSKAIVVIKAPKHMAIHRIRPPELPEGA